MEFDRPSALRAGANALRVCGSPHGLEPQRARDGKTRQDPRYGPDLRYSAAVLEAAADAAEAVASVDLDHDRYTEGVNPALCALWEAIRYGLPEEIPDHVLPPDSLRPDYRE